MNYFKLGLAVGQSLFLVGDPLRDRLVLAHWRIHVLKRSSGERFVSKDGSPFVVIRQW